MFLNGQMGRRRSKNLFPHFKKALFVVCCFKKAIQPAFPPKIGIAVVISKRASTIGVGIIGNIAGGLWGNQWSNDYSFYDGE